MAEDKPQERPPARGKTYVATTPEFPGHRFAAGPDLPLVTPEGTELDEAQAEQVRQAAKEAGVQVSITEKKG